MNGSLPVPSTSKSSLQLDVDENKYMIPCRFYAHGYCHKGTRCHFYHPPPEKLKTSIRVPPLPFGFEFGGGRDPFEGVQRERVLHPYNNRSRQVQRVMSPRYASTPRGHPFIGAHRNRFMMNAGRQLPRIPFGFGGGYSENATKYGDMEWEDPEFYPRDNGRVPLFIPPQQPELDKKAFGQNTVFQHIDWSDFLAPGMLPPPPVDIPIPKDTDDIKSYSATAADHHKAQSKQLSEDGDKEDNDAGDGHPKKLTAKQELHEKLREIALELAKEPKVPKISLMDRYFSSFKFTEETATLIMKPEDTPSRL